MRLTRVYVDAPLASGAQLELPPEAANHLGRVLRLAPGAACVLFDGRGGEYAARIAAVTRRQVTVEVGAHDPVERESPLRVELLQGLARGERMDYVVQKATELGVDALRPVQTLHSGVKLDADQASRKLAHWRAVAVGACEQSGRTRLPALRDVLPLDGALTATPTQLRLMLSLEGEPLPAAVARAGPGGSIALLVGPEGGLADAEESAARAAGFVPVTLGPRVLRTETAGIAALAVLQALAGDFAGGAGG